MHEYHIAVPTNVLSVFHSCITITILTDAHLFSKNVNGIHFRLVAYVPIDVCPSL